MLSLVYVFGRQTEDVSFNPSLMSHANEEMCGKNCLKCFAVLCVHKHVMWKVLQKYQAIFIRSDV